MYIRFFLAAFALAAISGNMDAQTQRRKMTLVAGGSLDRGKCTIEVVVDGAAEVEIRGDAANLRNLSEASPQWRRFECTGPLPGNPGDFRFAGVDGRGRQQLVRDPRSGGAAIVRIDDSGGGSEGYTFDIMWGRGAPPVQAHGEDRGFDRQGDRASDDRGPGSDRDGDGFYHDRAAAFRSDVWRTRIFARIRKDLDHVQRVTFPFGSDQHRIVRAQQQLDQLQNLLARGRYDRRELDDVVRALNNVVNDNRLAPRDREVLNDDLGRLQDFREHVRDYGVR
jgi:hypothetical protein